MCVCRVSIVSNGSVAALARSVLECHPLPCHGAPRTPASAWRYVRTRGLHDAGCEAAADRCSAAGAAGCSVHRVMAGYRVGRGGATRRMEDIMHEVRSQGPVLAIMEVTRDLFSYGGGVYHPLEDRVVGHHAVSKVPAEVQKVIVNVYS